MKMELDVNVLELKGKSMNIGEKLGLQKNKEKESFAIFQYLSGKSNINAGKEKLAKFDPDISDEIKGIALGLKISEADAFRYFSGYDIQFPALGCTVFMKNGFYVRNYDFSPIFYDKQFVLVKPETGYASVGFSEHLIGRLDG